MRIGPKRTFALGTALAVTVLATLVTGGAAANPADTRYVATTGTDAGNDCLTAASPCATIQYAVDQAADGDTVSVAAGTYTEAVTITKPISLVGAGSGWAATPFTYNNGLQTNSPSDGSGATIVVPPTPASGAATAITVRGTASSPLRGVRISGLTTNGLAAVVGSYVGIATGDASVAIDGAVINGNDGVAAGSLLTQGQGTVTVSDSILATNGNIAARNLGPAWLVLDGDNVIDVGDPPLLAEGYGVVTDGPTTIANSTVANVHDGVEANGASVSITRSLVAGDQTDPANPALSQHGGLLSVTDSVVYGAVELSGVTGTVSRSTLDNGIDLTSSGIALDNDTLTNSSAGVTADAASTTTAVGTLVSGTPACSGQVLDGGYNAASDSTCAWTAFGSSVISVGSAYGSATMVDLFGYKYAPIWDTPFTAGPLYDVIPPGVAGCGGQDQVGTSVPQGPACEIGSFEVPEQSSGSPTQTVTETVTATPPTQTVTLTVTAPAQTVTQTVTATAPAQTVTQTVTATGPAQTVTQTVTAPAQTQTVTQTVTATAPAQTVTQTVTATGPAQTVTQTVTATGPAQTVTQTVTATGLAQTQTVTQTVTATSGMPMPASASASPDALHRTGPYANDPTSTKRGLASTGSRTAEMLDLGFVACAVGAMLVLGGMPRRRTRREH
jgi:hypothetical protein